MASIIEVDTGALASDFSRLEQLIEQLRSAKNNLIKEMNEIDSMWEGPANAVFINQYSQDNEMFEHLIESLNRAVGCVGFARQNYDECDSEVSDLVSSLNV